MKTMRTQQVKFMRTLITGLFLIQALIIAQSDSKPVPSSSDSIPYATEHVILEGDSEAVILEKAAKVLPRPKQTAWFRMERTFFIHFGPNTFSHVEWGSGREEASIMNPTQLDAEKWVIAVKEAGESGGVIYWGEQLCKCSLQIKLFFTGICPGFLWRATEHFLLEEST